MLWPKKIHTRNLITKKNCCGWKIPQSQTSIRISRGTGSFRVVSQGLSRPVLENLPFLIFAFISFRFTYYLRSQKGRYTLFILHWFGLHYAFCYYSISINVVNNCRIRPCNQFPWSSKKRRPYISHEIWERRHHKPAVLNMQLFSFSIRQLNELCV